MANTDANLTAEVTLDAAGTADTITFNNAPTALLVKNVHATESAWVTINGDTPVAQAADTFRIDADEQKILKCPKEQQATYELAKDTKLVGILSDVLHPTYKRCITKLMDTNKLLLMAKGEAVPNYDSYEQYQEEWQKKLLYGAVPYYGLLCYTQPGQLVESSQGTVCRTTAFLAYGGSGDNHR